MVVTREDAPAKPRPEPLWMICEKLGVHPPHALMVGDFKFDIVAGRNAGTRTALLTNGKTPPYLKEIPPDHVLERLADLIALFKLAPLRMSIPLTKRHKAHKESSRPEVGSLCGPCLVVN
jgi:phosphoglycolate phosphatase-like HAD superfamily hydrolase